MLRTRILTAPAAAFLALALGFGGALVTTTSASAETSSVVTESSTLDTPESSEEQTCSPAEPEAEPDAEADCVIFEPPTLNFVDVSASAVQPTCSAAGSYTLSDTAGVVWMVDGVETAPGIHAAATGTSVSVEATPYLGGFTDDVRTNWTFDFAAPVACDPAPSVSETPSTPGTSIAEAPTAAGAAVATELPTLAVTGTNEQAVIIGLVALVLMLAGAGMVAARRRAEA